MNLLDSPFALLVGFIGVVGMAYSVSNHTSDFISTLLFGAMILVGLLSTYRRITGKTGSRKKPSGPLSRKKKPRKQ